VQHPHETLDQPLGREPLDYDELRRLDAAFHLRIVQAADNRLLEQSQAVLTELLLTGMRTTLEVPGRIEQSRSDHKAILAALLAGDADTAGLAAGAHVRGARDAANARILDLSTGSKVSQT